MVIPIIWIGVYPNPLLRRIEPSVIELIRRMETRGGVVDADFEVSPRPDSDSDSKSKSESDSAPAPDFGREFDSAPAPESGLEFAIPNEAEERL
jgi:hypothetical protein